MALAMIDLFAKALEGQAQAFAKAEGVAAAGVLMYRLAKPAPLRLRLVIAFHSMKRPDT
jgi:hypothetical protein